LIDQWKINLLLPERCYKRILKQNVLEGQANMVNRYSRNRVPEPSKAGDLVYYRNHPVSHAGRQNTAKLLHRWEYLFNVDSFLTPVTARLVALTTGNFVPRAHVRG
jgi:hypothetical protein